MDMVLTSKDTIWLLMMWFLLLRIRLGCIWIWFWLLKIRFSF